jgi:hypothetical protein
METRNLAKIPVIGGPHDGSEFSIPAPASPVLSLPSRVNDQRVPYWIDGGSPIPHKPDYRLARYVLRGNPLRYVYEHLASSGV